jgi:hypothetical protein
MSSQPNEFDKFRFGVFENDLFSNLWLAFASGNEFYLGVRSLVGKRMKFSFHGSGVCHVKVALKEEVETKLRWKRRPTPPTGAVHIATVRFPGGYNNGLKPASGRPNKPLFGIAAAPEGEVIEFGFFFSRDGMKVTEEKLSQFGLPMVRIGLPNGEAVSVVSRKVWLDEKSKAALRDWRLPVEAIPDIPKGGRVENLSAVFMNGPSETTPLILTNVQGFSLTRAR